MFGWSHNNCIFFPIGIFCCFRFHLQFTHYHVSKTLQASSWKTELALLKGLEAQPAFIWGCWRQSKKSSHRLTFQRALNQTRKNVTYGCIGSTQRVHAAFSGERRKLRNITYLGLKKNWWQNDWIFIQR